MASDNNWETVRAEQEQYYNSVAEGYINWSHNRVEKRLSAEARTYWLADCEQIEILRRKVIPSQGVVAEVGSGPSRLDMHSIKQLLCIDISLPMLRQARIRHQDRALLINANSQAIPLTDSAVDFIFCSELLSHMPDSLCLKSISEMFRILRSGGMFLLIDSYAPSTSFARIEGDVQWRKANTGEELRVYKKYRSLSWFIEHTQAEITDAYEGRFLFCIVWQKN